MRRYTFRKYISSYNYLISRCISLVSWEYSVVATRVSAPPNTWNIERNSSGTVQLLRNVEAAECEVDDSHCERGQSMLGARLPFVSYHWPILLKFSLISGKEASLSVKELIENVAKLNTKQFENFSRMNVCYCIILYYILWKYCKLSRIKICRMTSNSCAC